MLTVVMPSYNEEQIIEDSVREWHGEVVARIPGAELVVIDDCSTDATGSILDRLSHELPGVRSIHQQQNGGHGRALRHGFQHLSKEFVFQTDSDRQHKPAEFWRLWEIRENYDFVFGVRSQRADGVLRVVITHAMRLLIWALWRVWIRDANCPYKLMRSSALDQVLSHIPEDSFIPMVMVSIMARKMDFRFTEVPVTHLPRRGGTQSLKGILRWMRIARVCVKQLWDLRKLAP
ncbi:MAG: glycosyltransferase family 2 protein [Bryobacteraceae bacterium]|jgi:glycosyltransferase involved in cell wall biosynthesis